MLKGTHIATGIASAIVLTQPTAIPALISCLIGGSIGGALPDIDNRYKKRNNYDTDDDHPVIKEKTVEELSDIIMLCLAIPILFLLDLLAGNGISNYMINNFDIKSLIGLALFIILSIIGYSKMCSHRGFTHSFFALILLTASVYLFCRPLALTFGIGYFSHLFIDIFNKKGERLFFPFAKRFCLNLCKSNKDANTYLFWIMKIIDAFLIAFTLTNIFTNDLNLDFINKLSSAKLLGLNYLQIYLILINIVTFTYCLIAGKRLSEKEYFNTLTVKEDALLSSIFYSLILIGGGIGGMIYLIINLIFPFGDSGNLWAICYASLLTWITLYLHIVNPFDLAYSLDSVISKNSIIILSYFLLINIVGAIVFRANISKRPRSDDNKQLYFRILGFLGGSLGSLIIAIKFKKEDMFAGITFGLLVSLFSHVFLITYLITNI